MATTKRFAGQDDGWKNPPSKIHPSSQDPSKHILFHNEEQDGT